MWKCVVCEQFPRYEPSINIWIFVNGKLRKNTHNSRIFRHNFTQHEILSSYLTIFYWIRRRKRRKTQFVNLIGFNLFYNPLYSNLLLIICLLQTHAYKNYFTFIFFSSSFMLSFLVIIIILLKKNNNKRYLTVVTLQQQVGCSRQFVIT